MRLNLTLGVDSLEISAAFYHDLLGLPVEPVSATGGEPTALILRCGQVSVLLEPLTQHIARHPTLFQNLEHYPRGTGVRLEFTCRDLGLVLKKLQNARIPLAYELEDREFDRKKVWVHDPDGYLLVLNQEGDGAEFQEIRACDR